MRLQHTAPMADYSDSTKMTSKDDAKNLLCHTSMMPHIYNTTQSGHHTTIPMPAARCYSNITKPITACKQWQNKHITMRCPFNDATITTPQHFSRILILSIHDAMKIPHEQCHTNDILTLMQWQQCSNNNAEIKMPQQWCHNNNATMAKL